MFANANRAMVSDTRNTLDTGNGSRCEEPQHRGPIERWSISQTQSQTICGDHRSRCAPKRTGCQAVVTAKQRIEPPNAFKPGGASDLHHGKLCFGDQAFRHQQAIRLCELNWRHAKFLSNQTAELT